MLAVHLTTLTFLASGLAGLAVVLARLAFLTVLASGLAGLTVLAFCLTRLAILAHRFTSGGHFLLLIPVCEIFSAFHRCGLTERTKFCGVERTRLVKLATPGSTQLTS